MSTAPIPNPIPTVEVPSGPWWKYAHMWMVVGGPLIVVVAAFVTLWLAIRTPDPVYSDTDGVRARGAATLQPADEPDSAALAPAMQARNHAATGGVQRNAGPAPGAHP